METKTVYKLKCNMWKRQYCVIEWVLDGKAEYKSFLILPVFNCSVSIFTGSVFSCEEKNLQDVSCLAFMSSIYLVVVCTKTVDSSVVF